MIVEQRDLLLVPFPFSDQSGRKVRPVIVVSNNHFNASAEDIIVVGVTSNITKDAYTLPLDNTDLEEGKLLESSCIKVENILKIDKELVIKKIGRLKEEKVREILSLLQTILK